MTNTSLTGFLQLQIRGGPESFEWFIEAANHLGLTGVVNIQKETASPRGVQTAGWTGTTDCELKKCHHASIPITSVIHRKVVARNIGQYNSNVVYNVCS